jgi:hypothetical protein
VSESSGARLEEGWYLMSIGDLERELARLRDPEAELPPSGARRLSIADALAYRDAGNRPDEHGRTLRLVLLVERGPGAPSLEAKRLSYEPDYHRPPAWRGPGSAPVNVVPLRPPSAPPAPDRPWFEEPELAALEAEWRATGALSGLRLPADIRGFVYKTALALRSAGEEVGVDTIVASVSRWLSPEDARRVGVALEEANREHEGGE